jgi:DNA-directed RNA polymerase subunit M/transcription elongation factor TFIIS
MRFCKVCQNLYYIKLTGENEDDLIYYCRNCGDEDTDLMSSLENVCVSKSEKNDTDNDNSYKHIINKYTKLDPTLPRIYNIKCPNVDCITNIQDKKNDEQDKEEGKDESKQEKVDTEILYLRYDDTNMKFIYLCTHCDTVWKSSSDKR